MIYFGSCDGPRDVGIAMDANTGNIVWKFHAAPRISPKIGATSGGTSPIATFTVPLSGEASSCSVDQTTGNLAATAFSVGSDGPLVLVYQKGEYQYPQSYEDASIFSFFSCSYDNNGNLYADGNSTGENYLLTELPHGGSALQSLSLDPSDDPVSYTHLDVYKRQPTMYAVPLGLMATR